MVQTRGLKLTSEILWLQGSDGEAEEGGRERERRGAANECRSCRIPWQADILLCTRSTSGDVWLISCENSRLPRQEAAGGGVTGNREGVNYFHILENSRQSLFSWQYWHGTGGRGERWGCAGIGRVVVELCLGWNSCDGDPSLSVEEWCWYMIIQHGSSFASSLGRHGPIIPRLSATPDPGDKHSQTHST